MSDYKLTTKDAITVLRDLQDWLYFSSMNGGTSIQREAIDMAVRALEQPEIIHCGDCKHKDDGIPFLKCLNGRSYGGTRINDYCSWAERRTDE